MWAGNVEIHIKSSDWYAHNHETDSNYDNVILHVVWEDDIAVFRSDSSEIPTLELKKYISEELLANYHRLFEQKPNVFINCGADINSISSFSFENWKERLYLERLERKSEFIFNLLETSKNDWEKVLFVLLLKNFGSKINGELFLELGLSIDFSIIRKLQGRPLEMEALLFGLAGLLEEQKPDSYQNELRKTYDYLRHKYEMDSSLVPKPQFFKLRPPNFPTIRLSQFVQLYASVHSLFHLALNIKGVELYNLFSIPTSDYWETHFTFGKASKKSSKKNLKEVCGIINCEYHFTLEVLLFKAPRRFNR